MTTNSSTESGLACTDGKTVKIDSVSFIEQCHTIFSGQVLSTTPFSNLQDCSSSCKALENCQAVHGVDGICFLVGQVDGFYSMDPAPGQTAASGARSFPEVPVQLHDTPARTLLSVATPGFHPTLVIPPGMKTVSMSTPVSTFYGTLFLTSTGTSSAQNSTEHAGISSSAVAAVTATGVVAGVGLLGLGVFLLWRRKNSAPRVVDEKAKDLGWT